MNKTKKTSKAAPVAKTVGRPARHLSFPPKAPFTANYLFEREAKANRSISKVAILNKINKAVAEKTIIEIGKKAGSRGRPSIQYKVAGK